MIKHKQAALLRRPLIRFGISLLVVCALATIAFTIIASAEPVTDNTPIVTTSPLDNEALVSADDSLLQQLIGVDMSQSLEVVLLVTVLSLAPSILVMTTSFVRIIIVFGFLRNAMATQQTPPNMVLTGLALFLTLFIMSPVFSQIKEVAYDPYKAEEVTALEAVELAADPLKEFMLRQTSNKDMTFFLNLAGKDPEIINSDNYMEELGLEVVIPAFITSELKEAFTMGFLLFIPFLVIDIVVASVLMSMGMMMLPPAMISLPFKIMLFVLVDGWQLLIGSLVKSFS